MFQRALRLSAITLGFVCLGGGAALAADYQVPEVSIQSQDGRAVSLKVKGKKSGGGSNRATIKVFWVNGANRQEVYSGQGRFEGAGIENNLPSINLPGEEGRLEVEVQGEGDSVPNNNKKTQVVGGTNLGFETQLVEEISGARAGADNKKVSLKIKNHGPGALAANACKVRTTFTAKAGKRAPAAVERNIPALPRRAMFQTPAMPFKSADVDSYSASITCATDYVVGNNSQSARF